MLARAIVGNNTALANATLRFLPEAAGVVEVGDVVTLLDPKAFDELGASVAEELAAEQEKVNITDATPNKAAKLKGKVRKRRLLYSKRRRLVSTRAVRPDGSAAESPEETRRVFAEHWGGVLSHPTQIDRASAAAFLAYYCELRPRASRRGGAAIRGGPRHCCAGGGRHGDRP